MIETQFVDIDKQENSDGSSGSVSNFSEPISLAEAKAHLIITSDDDDVYLEALISACRATMEQYCHISIVEKIITLTTESCQKPLLKWGPPNRYYDNAGKDYEPQIIFELPEGPVTELISITSINSDGTTQTLILGTDYQVIGTSFKTVKINNGYINNVLVYMTGYNPAKIPYNLKLAILAEIAYRYENRGDKTNRYAQQNVGLSEAAEYLAFPFKRMEWL
jgi:hypothetical protein